MKIHRVELNHVRQFRHVALDVSAPLTIIGGPNGVGKSTLQKAVLAAMFQVEKKERESLKSRFDPDTPPAVALVLSRGDGFPPCTLTRRLTDDAGEWREGATVVKHKGAALKKVQESLRISAEAASILLWGTQENMAALIDAFPSDGHSLLTTATIRGAGPDPNVWVEYLEKEIKRTKKTGAAPGPLTQATDKVTLLAGEVEKARDAEGKLKELRKQFDDAKRTATEARSRREKIENRGKEIKKLVGLLETAVGAMKTSSQLEAKQEERNSLDEQFGAEEKTLKGLHEELRVLESQYRVARDKELAEKIRRLGSQLESAEAAERRRTEADTKLKAKRRPDKSDEANKRTMEERIRQATDRMGASGVRYEVSVQSAARKIRVSEDNATAKEVTVVPGTPHESVVGSVVVWAENLRVAASGKEDIGRLKRTIDETQRELKALFGRFAVANADQFDDLRRETKDLEDVVRKEEAQRERELKGSTITALKSDLSVAKRAQLDNRVSQKDKDAFGARHLGAASEIANSIARKNGELETAGKMLGALSAKLPNEEQRAKLGKDLRSACSLTEKAIGAFQAADEDGREPSEELLEELRTELEGKRDEYRQLTSGPNSPESEVTRLSTELKYAAPERPVSSIEGDLEEAKAVLHREELLQDGRDVLKERIEQKILEMTADVPRDLADKVSKNLARFTKGAYAGVTLDEQFAISSVRDCGGAPEQWATNHLSHGERNQTALAVKIAVARALTETSGCIFVILDDSLVSFDPTRREATENHLLDLVADGKLQVILLTCHTDWAADWKKRRPSDVNYIELANVAEYYRPHPALASA